MRKKTEGVHFDTPSYNTVPVTVEYELTSSGFRLKELIAAMIQWGVAHREYVKSVNIND